jgi:hypothetical protein
MQWTPMGLTLVAVLTLAPPARAQDSPVADLLVRARVALNGLRYAEADSLAAAVLATFGDRLNRQQRIEALSVCAASLYPDPTGGGARRPDSALAYLRRIVRVDPSTFRVPPDLSWPGLDSLYGVARRTTFAAYAEPQERNIISGPNGLASVDVHATRPARFRLALAPATGGAPVLADSAGPAVGVALRLRAMRNGRPLLSSGSYTLTIVALDSATGDSTVMRYGVTVDAPPLDLEPIPGALDPSQLRPEMAPPARGRGVLAGLLAGGAAVFAASLKGPGPLAGARTDSRSYVVGAALALGAVVGGFLDRGHPLPANVAANRRLRAQLAESQRAARTANLRRLGAYYVTITIGPEAT